MNDAGTSAVHAVTMRAARDVAQDWLAAYADAVDTADVDALARLCADVTVRGPTGAQASGEGVAILYRPLVLPPGADGRRRTKHHITNVSVHVDDHSAVARAYYLLVKNADGTIRVDTSGRYETALALTESGWKVSEHLVTRDLTTTV